MLSSMPTVASFSCPQRIHFTERDGEAPRTFSTRLVSCKEEEMTMSGGRSICQLSNLALPGARWAGCAVLGSRACHASTVTRLCDPALSRPELLQSGTMTPAAVEPLETQALWHSLTSVRIVSLDLSKPRRWWPLSQCSSSTAHSSSTALGKLSLTVHQGR